MGLFIVCLVKLNYIFINLGCWNKITGDNGYLIWLVSDFSESLPNSLLSVCVNYPPKYIQITIYSYEII